MGASAKSADRAFRYKASPITIGSRLFATIAGPKTPSYQKFTEHLSKLPLPPTVCICTSTVTVTATLDTFPIYLHDAPTVAALSVNRLLQVIKQAGAPQFEGLPYTAPYPDLMGTLAATASGDWRSANLFSPLGDQADISYLATSFQKPMSAPQD